MIFRKMAGSNYASVHRSDTSRRPYLSLSPVNDSLTEGTDIPAPPPPPPPEVISETPTAADREKLSATVSGPLSSHPVTPNERLGSAESDGRQAYPFPAKDGMTNGTSQRRASKVANEALVSAEDNASSNEVDDAPMVSTPTNGRTVDQAHGSPYSQHRHNNHSSDIMPPPPKPREQQTLIEAVKTSPPDQPLSKHRSRRSSFAERFMRLRSLSSLKGWNNSRSSGLPDGNNNASESSLSKHQGLGNSTGTTSTARGMKRPASPSPSSIFALNASQNPESMENGARNSQSFPRLVRKKSMELLGSARRMSGMWGRTTTGGMGGGKGDDSNSVEWRNGRMTPVTNLEADAYADERERERMMDDDSEWNPQNSSESGYGGSRRYSSSNTGTGRNSLATKDREPPPMLPDLREEHELDGNALFGHIGKEDMDVTMTGS